MPWENALSCSGYSGPTKHRVLQPVKTGGSRRRNKGRHRGTEGIHRTTSLEVDKHMHICCYRSTRDSACKAVVSFCFLL